jgi:hypothetical protein
MSVELAARILTRWMYGPEAKPTDVERWLAQHIADTVYVAEYSEPRANREIKEKETETEVYDPRCLEHGCLCDEFMPRETPFEHDKNVHGCSLTHIPEFFNAKMRAKREITRTYLI